MMGDEKEDEMEENQGNGGVLWKELSYEIVGAAIQVWKTLGHGYLEKVYENAMMIELRKRGLPCEQQKPVSVRYDGTVIGEYFADILVDGKIILELKCAKTIAEAHLAQALNYLKASGLRLAIILNFGPGRMESKRVVL